MQISLAVDGSSEIIEDDLKCQSMDVVNINFDQHVLDS